METTTVMLCGVGGQGTILAADLLAKVAAASGLDVKLSEVHGMSQRGGGVDTVVRFGEKVYAPISDLGSVDHLVAFELIEGRRLLPYLKKDGVLIVNDTTIAPIGVLVGTSKMPTHLHDDLEAVGAHIFDATEMATRAGSPRSANVVLMGALSTALPFDVEVWEEIIAKRVPPKTVEANLAAFQAGRALMSEEGVR